MMYIVYLKTRGRTRDHNEKENDYLEHAETLIGRGVNPTILGIGRLYTDIHHIDTNSRCEAM